MVLLMVPSHIVGQSVLMVCFDENTLIYIFLVTNLSCPHWCVMITSSSSCFHPSSSHEWLGVRSCQSRYLLKVTSCFHFPSQTTFARGECVFCIDVAIVLWSCLLIRNLATWVYSKCRWSTLHTCPGTLASNIKINNGLSVKASLLKQTCIVKNFLYRAPHLCLWVTATAPLLQHYRQECVVLKGRLCQYIVARWKHVGVILFDLLLPSVAGFDQELYSCIKQELM